ncbi:MAG: hypothetical protein F6K54_38285 [Okeania sp. SIO3B5]|uniref:hypothetical protein n=1 Tax=Okeania sp. SIO3B5 TaxID=2607811 RepID=UPI001400CB12|nr:hypothetical protein [Okeania sp. SIO3B5]NEO58393.1 hypothetical protein [Okeania sp. SIO3B5]
MPKKRELNLGISRNNQQLDTDSGTDKRIHYLASSVHQLDTDSGTDKRINHLTSSGQDTDSGTDKRIHYLASFVYLWQNPCLAFFEVNSAMSAIILVSD